MSDRQQPSVDTDWFTYNAPFGTIAHGASGVFNLQIQQDSAFQLFKLAYYATLVGGDAPFTDDQIAELGLFITDNGSGRQLMDRAVPISSIAGTGRLPFVLPETRIFKANSTVNINMNNFSGANDYENISLSFIGRKLYPM